MNFSASIGPSTQWFIRYKGQRQQVGCHFTAFYDQHFEELNIHVQMITIINSSTFQMKYEDVMTKRYTAHEDTEILIREGDQKRKLIGCPDSLGSITTF